MQVKTLQIKKALRTALLVLLLNAVGTVKGHAQNFDFLAVCSTGQTLYYQIGNDSTVMITYPFNVGVIYFDSDIFYNGYQKPTGRLIIPTHVMHEGVNYSVKYIDACAFCFCEGLTSVVIPNTIQHLQYCVFSCCSNLTSVTIPNSVISIGDHAFYGCNKLTSISIPSSVLSIGVKAFCYSGWYNNQSDGVLYLSSWCLGYKGNKPTGSLSIKNGTKGIAQKSFYQCTGLSSINIPNSVEFINNSSFYQCEGLTQVTIPSSITYLSGYAFSNCTRLTKVFFNASNCSDPYSSISPFKGCTSLSMVTFGNTVQKIPYYAFRSCSGLTSIIVNPNNSIYDSRDNCNAIIETATNTIVFGCKTSIIPNTVIKIGNQAFSSCYGLTSIIIPDSVTEIGTSAFSGCENLTTITIPKAVSSIHERAFSGCKNLANLNFEAENCSIANSYFYYDNPFCGCIKLETIRISDNVRHISNLWSVSGYLLSFEVAEGNVYYKSEEGVLFNYEKDTLIQYPLKKQEDTSFHMKPK